jgi:hypothetical protein
MNTKLFLLPVALLSFLALSSVSTHSQTIITFDSPPLSTGNGSFIVSPYEGLSWSNFGRVNGVLNPTVYPSITNGFYYGVVSASNVAVNAGGAPSEVDSLGTNFEFLGAYFTGGWHSNLNIEVQGFRSGTLLYDTTVVASATSPTLFTFNYLNIDRLYFNSFGGQTAFGFDGRNQFAMDNLSVEFIPEHTSLLLAALGALMLWPFLKRRQA